VITIHSSYIIFLIIILLIIIRNTRNRNYKVLRNIKKINNI